MFKIDHDNRFYYQKIGGICYIAIILLSTISFVLMFEMKLQDSSLLGFYMLFLVFLLGGPVSLAFVGSVATSFYIPAILCPALFLPFIKKKIHFIILSVVFVLYWVSWGALNFIAYIYS